MSIFRLFRPAVLVVSAAVFVFLPRIGLSQTETEPVLPGSNSLSDLRVTQDNKGRWLIDFDYFYTGSPSSVYLWPMVGVKTPSGEVRNFRVPMVQPKLERGSHHLSLEIQRPNANPDPMTTDQVTLDLRSMWVNRGPNDPKPKGPEDLEKIYSHQHVDISIKWPSASKWDAERMYVVKTPDEILDDVANTIDLGVWDSLVAVKPIVERLIAQDPNYAPAYLELARISMKSNWGPEGLHQAEVLIRSALAIRPNDANANVLLGYVYVHQKRNKEAERLFEEAAANGTANLWLWANWGELLVAEGKVDQGIEKYREAITKPRSKATYDRARLDAFEKLIMLFKKQQRNSEVEKLYQQRIAEFGEDGCFNAEFARYVLDQRGDANLAAELARKEIAGRCSTPESKEVLGLANYVAWAGATEPSAQDYLNQAHVNLPMGARTLYLLATSERMIPAIRKLIATGESIEQRDNRKWNALAHALKERDYLAVPRLVRLGSRVDSVVGYDDMPVSIIPVIQDDPEGIRLMKKLGVNYGSLKFHGVSIFEQIKRSGNQKLIDAIGSGSSRT